MNTLQIGDVSLHEKEGGLGRYFSELLRHLPLTGAGHHGLVVGEASESEQGSVSSFAAMSDSLAVRDGQGPRRAALARMQHTPVDVLAAHFAPYGLPLLDRGSALVVHFHGPWAAESSAEAGSGIASKAKAAIERLVYRRAERLIVLSEYFKRELVRRYGVDDQIVRVVPGGIDTDRFNMEMSREAEARATTRVAGRSHHSSLDPQASAAHGS